MNYSEIYTEPTLDAPIVKPSENHDVESMRKYLSETAKAIATDTTNFTMAYAQEQINKMLDDTRQKLAEFSQAKKLIRHVKIGENPVRELSSRESPYLPELIMKMKAQKIGSKLWPLLVGDSGTGKTTLVMQAAEALGLPFYFVSCNEEMSIAWYTGMQTAQGYVPADFVRAVKDGGVFLNDEHDASNPNALLMLNAVLSNGIFYNPTTGERFTMHKDFYFVAASNTFGKGSDEKYTGRNRLDAASNQRFIPIFVDYDEEFEDEVCENEELKNILWDIRDGLRKIKSGELITTRYFQYADVAYKSGFTINKIIEDLTASWPEGLFQQLQVKLPEGPQVQVEDDKELPKKRGRGRPKGSLNKPKFDQVII